MPIGAQTIQSPHRRPELTIAELSRKTRYDNDSRSSDVSEAAAHAVRIDDLQITLEGSDPGAGNSARNPDGTKQGPDSGQRIGPLSASVPQGGYHIITGPNGAGKSALVAVIALAAPPAAGSLRILGHEIASRRSGNGNSADRAVRKALRRRIGAVFQTLTPLPGATVLDTVLLPVRLLEPTDNGRTGAGPPAGSWEAAARELLHWVGLGGRDRDRADSLSGGEARCLALARALIRRPEILIADDPTRGLDERAAWRMMGLIEQLHRQGTTIIVATNDPAFLQSQSHPLTDLGGRGRRTAATPTASPP